MPESADEVYARVRAAAGDGRLPAPPTVDWEVFPWEVVDGAIVPKVLQAPGAEQPREGEDGRPCPRCEGTIRAETVWEDENWLLTTVPEPSGLPVVLTMSGGYAGDLADIAELHANSVEELRTACG